MFELPSVLETLEPIRAGSYIAIDRDRADNHLSRSAPVSARFLDRPNAITGSRASSKFKFTTTPILNSLDIQVQIWKKNLDISGLSASRLLVFIFYWYHY
jgi:hypothetical protein